MKAISAFTESSSFRVGVLLTSLAAIAIVFILYFWRIASSDVFLKEAEAALKADVFTFTQLYQVAGIEAVENALINRIQMSDYHGLLGLHVNNRRMGNLLTVPTALPAYPGITRIEIAVPPAAQTADTMARMNKSDVLVTQVALGQHTLLVGRNIDYIHTAQWLGRTFSWVIVALLCMVCILAFFVAVYVVNRINRMAFTADKIIRTGSLQERLEIDSKWDDLSQLAKAFNQMLDKIEEAVGNIKSVTDNIAHDLRTPLSRLRSTLENIDDQLLRDTATSEADNLLNMFNSLLRISDIESRRHREGFTHVQLDQLLCDVIDMYHPLAEDKHIVLESDVRPVSLHADPNLLFQAIANVIDNAVKYSHKNGRIAIVLSETSNCIVLSVNDNGIGIGVDEAARLERRFFRSELSRTTHGNGLGLSLVSAIVALHYGQLWFVYDPLLTGSGLGVTMTFPLAKPTVSA